MTVIQRFKNKLTTINFSESSKTKKETKIKKEEILRDLKAVRKTFSDEDLQPRFDSA